MCFRGWPAKPVKLTKYHATQTVIERMGTVVMASVNTAMIAMVKSLTLFVEVSPVQKVWLICRCVH